MILNQTIKKNLLFICAVEWDRRSFFMCRMLMHWLMIKDRANLCFIVLTINYPKNLWIKINLWKCHELCAASDKKMQFLVLYWGNQLFVFVLACIHSRIIQNKSAEKCVRRTATAVPPPTKTTTTLELLMLAFGHKFDPSGLVHAEKKIRWSNSDECKLQDKCKIPK